MVTAVTNLGRNGVGDWVIQRLSSVILTLYTVVILIYLVTTPDLDYPTWRALFDQLWMRVFSLLALLSLAGHSWVGLWNVVTDYVTERLMGPKALAIRMIILGVYALVIASYLVWGVDLLWGF